MGPFLREYWWPVIRSAALEPDGAPQRVRLLSQDFIVFRATDGRVGFFDEGCPHRGAPLVLARNEDCALRCLLHGWKLDVSGRIVETPNEKGERRADRVQFAYPVEEAGGMVWAWIGSGEAPPLPSFVFNTCEAVGGEVVPVRAEIHCNWIQLMETLWDPTHHANLHSRGEDFDKSWDGLKMRMLEDGRERIKYASGYSEHIEPYGFRFRFEHAFVFEPGRWSITAMPGWVFIGPMAPEDDSDRVVFGHVPVDDTHSVLWELVYNPERPLNETGHNIVKFAHDPDNWRRPGLSKENNWGQDRAAMKTGSHTGIGVGGGPTGILEQDIAIVESMGPILDRTREHLGPADRGVLRGRKTLIAALRAYQAGEKPLGIDADLSYLGVPPQRASV
jgi:phthalate 4,5-dioxygenase oxygenase subunit